jgi:hypothetical protein
MVAPMVRSGGVYVWRESGVRRSVLCWCVWQESGFRCREDVLTFNSVENKFYKFCTFNAICTHVAPINCITVHTENSSFRQLWRLIRYASLHTNHETFMLQNVKQQKHKLFRHVGYFSNASHNLSQSLTTAGSTTKNRPQYLKLALQIWNRLDKSTGNPVTTATACTRDELIQSMYTTPGLRFANVSLLQSTGKETKNEYFAARQTAQTRLEL